MKIIAGIPAQNNRLCIASLIDGADEHVDEIIVVDDGSEDKTVKITERTCYSEVNRRSEEARCRCIGNDRGEL